MIALVLVATQLRGLFGAGWLVSAVGGGLGMRAVIQVLARALTVELGFLVIAAIVLFAAGGAKRNLGRAFDLACVAAIPLFVVALVATTFTRGLELALGHFDMPQVASLALAGISYAWTGALVALALRPARAGGVHVPDAAIATLPLAVAKRAGLAVIAIAVAGTAIQGAWLASNMESMRPMTDGDPAPEFALPLIAKAGSAGDRVTLSQHRGKIVIVDFWATWCGPCLKAMPKLESISRRYAGQVEVIAVNLDDAAKARAMFDEGGYKMTLVADDGQVSNRYGVSTIPHSVVIDRDGVVRSVYRGSSSQLASDVEALLAKK